MTSKTTRRITHALSKLKIAARMTAEAEEELRTILREGKSPASASPQQARPHEAA